MCFSQGIVFLFFPTELHPGPVFVFVITGSLLFVLGRTKLEAYFCLQMRVAAESEPGREALEPKVTQHVL